MVADAGCARQRSPSAILACNAKQGKYMPGSRIPIVDEGRLRRDRPDYVVVLPPWNLKTEVVQQLAYVRRWGGALVTTIPHIGVVR